MRNLSKHLFAKQVQKENYGLHVKTSLFNNVVDNSFSLYKKDLLAHYGCVNAVEFSEDGQVFVSGSDDRRVLLWQIGEVFHEKEKPKPVAMEAEHGSNVFCLSIAPEKDKIVSGGNDFQVIVHDSWTGKPLDYFLHEKPVYGVSIQPLNSNIFSTTSEDGKVRIFDTRAASQDVLASRRSPIHSVMFNPIEPRIVAIACAKDGVELFDLRVPHKCLKGYQSNRGAMSARFNSTGDKLLCLRRRDGPIIYNTFTDQETSLNSDGYSNACTMKSCCFAGRNSEWAVSGSDDHNVYVWKVPDIGNTAVDRAHMVLRGHRSVVNHVRYNDSACCLASSGVEKMIKIWSPVRLPGSTGGLDQEANETFKPRKRFSRDFSMVIAPSPNVRLSTDEDKKMLAFFDLLVERAAWVSSGEDSDVEEEFEFEIASSNSSSSDVESQPNSDDSFQIETLSTPSTTSSSSSSSPSDSDDEPRPGPSGLHWGDDSVDEEPKLDLPAAFQRFVNPRTESSSDEDLDQARDDVPESPDDSPRVPFKKVLKRNRRGSLRTRTRSTSSSSS